MMSTKERLVFKMLYDACDDFCKRYVEGKPKYKQHYLQMSMAVAAADSRETAAVTVASTNTNAPEEQNQGEIKHDTNTAANA